MTLAKLQPGEHAVITDITADEHLTKRLQALGLRNNRLVTIIRHAPFNGPMHVQIGTTDIIIRNNVAELISVAKIQQ